MLSSQIPTKFQMPFGKNAAPGTIRAIPIADQTATSPGAASLTTGFPVATGQPLASGGVPPAMQDFNGLFFQDTAWAWWQAAGGTVGFDQSFCTAIGGYPAGAFLASTTAGMLWLSVAENNLTNPDTPSATGWVGIVTTLSGGASAVIVGGLKTASYQQFSPGTYTVTVPANCTGCDSALWGGGGGGGGVGSTSNGSGSAGGGGGYSFKTISGLTPGQAITLVVGAGGTAGGNGGAGGSGGSTTLGSYHSATGGAGGSPNGIGQGGQGGSGSGGDQNLIGGYGSAGASVGVSTGGQGGGAPLGGQGGGGAPGIAASGTSPGGGGGGSGSTTVNPGAAGAPGGCILRWK